MASVARHATRAVATRHRPRVITNERGAIGSDRWRDLEAIEPIIKTGLAVDLKDRWATAADMEHALIDAVRPASLGEVSTWLKSLGREFLDKHDRVLAAEEASWRRSSGSPLTPVPGSLMLPRVSSRPSVVSQLSTTAQGAGQAYGDDRRRFGSNALIGLADTFSKVATPRIRNAGPLIPARVPK